MTEALTALFRAAGIEPRSPGGSVWDLHERGLLASVFGVGSTLTPELRRQIIQVFLSGAHPVLLCTGDDPTEDTTEAWSVVAPHIWRLNGRADAASVLGNDAIQNGNWVMLSAAEAPIEPIPDLIRASEEAVMSFLRANRIHALVDSFHDDVHWRVAVAP